LSRGLGNRAARCGVPLLVLAVVGAGCEDATGVNREPPEILWEVASPNGPRTRPLLIDSLVVFGTFDGQAVAYHQETGEVIWARKLSDFVWGREVTTAAGHVLVAEYELWALDPRTGATRWRYGGPDGAAGVDEPAIVGDTLYLGSAFGWASAVDGATGQERWTVDLAERLFRPTIAGDLVIYGTRSFQGANRDGPLGAGHVIALRRGDGSEAWRFEIPDSAGFPLSGGAVNGGVVWEDRVVTGTMTSRVQAVRLSDGQLLWERPSGNPALAPYDRRPVLLGETVIMTRSDGLVEGWNPETGERRWSRPGNSSPADPAVVLGAIYLVASTIWIVTEEGESLWEWGGGSPSFSGSPAVNSDGRIFLWGTRGAGQEAIAFALDPPVKP
jgi:outer membrane protein assembly factor BamB